ncbi:ECF transporter S component [Clostridium perfringens]|uniref:Riboflavin transporter n=2 Tax=Clostridium perfringens TaxID=1502 RepID=A0A2X2Y092_CLOPF|nr:ECF transporter S component [Clostridium perfringens]ALG49769.1 Substrate-specific component RibU of riboflavin ECF transporter [Clostridium perfringens]AQW24710.1 ECF transporter S component [Clostridium perfringens]AXH53359.1 ECF transporter S component [Clostridium perfringens]EDS79793.1 putative membrane protein [Clostridium perfringens C str. JGS1495]EDT15605.1 putative membrane protein [Clostridium perfringens E str. JGS1987]
MKTKTLNTNRFIKLSLLSAIAVILMYIDFPVIPIFPWLKIDLSDVPALMGAFAFGPLAGLIIELMKNLLILIVKGTGTGFVGELANFLVGVALVWPAALVYKKNKTKKTAILGMVLGVLCIEVVGILANVYLLLPAYGMAMSKAELMQYVTVGLIPFNGIKSILVCGITYALYKKVSVSIFKVEPMLDKPKQMKENLG